MKQWGLLFLASTWAWASNSATLKELSDQSHILIGCAVNSEIIQDPLFSKILTENCTSFTPEVALKWKRVEKASGKFDFSEGQKIVSAARGMGGIRVRGHTLLWEHGYPPWLEEKLHKGDPKEIEKLLQKYIEKTVSYYSRHFPGLVETWDVANESISPNQGLSHPAIFSDDQFYDLIRKAYTWAHEADPKSTLFYNDYNIETPGSKSDRAYDLLKKLLADKAPIQGLGIQLHKGVNEAVDWPAARKNLERFEKLGLAIELTEVDYALEKVDAESLQKQKEFYKEAVRLCRSLKSCHRVTIWGVTDKYNWLEKTGWRAVKAPFLFDEKGNKKPAFDGVVEALRNE